MDKREGLRAGIAEMRSVAQRLNRWADDLEASFRGKEAPADEVDAGKQVRSLILCWCWMARRASGSRRCSGC